MTLKMFFENFDRFAEAPNAMARMRELLLRLAVQGALARNDPVEEAVPLKFTEVGSSRSIPSNWRSGYLGDVLVFEYGENLPASRRTESGEYAVYGSNGVVGTHNAYLTKEPAIIVGRKGSAGALNVALEPSWTTDVAYFVRPPNCLDLRFTYYLLASLRLDELGKGIKPGLSRRDAYALRVSLPPLAEQKRIVVKLDELTSLCDQLQEQQRARDAIGSRLLEALRDGLTTDFERKSHEA